MLNLVSALKVKDLKVEKMDKTKIDKLEDYFNINLKSKVSNNIIKVSIKDYQIYHNLVFVNIDLDGRSATWIMKATQFNGI